MSKNKAKEMVSRVANGNLTGLFLHVMIARN